MTSNSPDASIQSAPDAAEHDTGLTGIRRRLAIAAVLCSLVLVVLDAVIASVALPNIAQSLHVTDAMSVSVVTIYQMAIVMALLPSAALGDSLGHSRVFTAGVIVFTGASLLCAMSPSLPWLVVARFFQGLGAAAVMSLTLALLRSIVPQRQLGIAIGWNATVIALASAAGPTIGAAILSVAAWPWLFAVNLPIGIFIILACRALPRVEGSGRAVDVVSVALNALSFAACIIGPEVLPTNPVGAAVVVAAGVAGMIVLVRREAPKVAPLFPLDLLRVSSFRISMMASICFFASQTAAMVALPFYLQHGLGQSTLMTGLYITAWPLTVAVAAPFGGTIAGRMSSAWICATGGALIALGLIASSLWPLKDNPHALIPMMMLCGFGYGIFQVANNRNMFLSAPRERSGAAGGMQGTARLTGQTFGAVLMTLLFTFISGDAAPRVSLGIGAGLALAASLISLLRGGLYTKS